MIYHGTSWNPFAEAKRNAVTNIDALFENLKRLESKPDRDSSPDIKAVHRYYAPMYFNSEVSVVKLTVKEIRNPYQKNRIYSVESIDIKKTSEQSVEANLQTDGQPQYPDVVKTFFDSIEKVNQTLKHSKKKVDEDTFSFEFPSNIDFGLLVSSLKKCDIDEIDLKIF